MAVVARVGITMSPLCMCGMIFVLYGFLPASVCRLAVKTIKTDQDHLRYRIRSCHGFLGLSSVRPVQWAAFSHPDCDRRTADTLMYLDMI